MLIVYFSIQSQDSVVFQQIIFFTKMYGNYYNDRDIRCLSSDFILDICYLQKLYFISLFFSKKYFLLIIIFIIEIIKIYIIL